MLNFSLSPELKALQQEARAFARRELLPVAWEYDQRDETPLHILHKAYDAGLINGDIPKAYGGKGFGSLRKRWSMTRSSRATTSILRLVMEGCSFRLRARSQGWPSTSWWKRAYGYD